MANEDTLWGEIKLLPYDYEPLDWALCDGRRMKVKGNEALYSLLGTRYGGDDHEPPEWFSLPDLRPTSWPRGRRDWRDDEPRWMIHLTGSYPSRN